MYSCLFSKEHYLCKLDGVAPLVADPSPANSTTDSETQPISHGQHTFYGQQNWLCPKANFTWLQSNLYIAISLNQ